MNNQDRKIDRSKDISRPLQDLHPDERMKYESLYLRGSIPDSLADPVTGAVAEGDAKLLKFHGIYQQDHRDVRDERRRQKLEPAYMFMVRLRLPGGVCDSRQLVQLINISETYANGTLRLTTRQTFQLHEVLKKNLKPLIQALQSVGLDTLAACGDDTRGVMCAVNPHQSDLHSEVYAIARQISNRFIPKTGAYGEIWLDRRQQGPIPEEEPMYGRTYLPRKFKIGIVVPPVNDIDVYAQDIGFVAIADGNQLVGYNVCVGGGMGHTDNISTTYPRLADVIGYIDKKKIFDVIEAVITIQRDFGNRADRAYARFKYTLDRIGLDWFVDELENRAGYRLEQARFAEFHKNGDQIGWQGGKEGDRHYTLFVENGRLGDTTDRGLMQGLREVALLHRGEFRLTPNQNLMIANVDQAHVAQIEDILYKYHLIQGKQISSLRANSMACVALPTCGLAMAESERYLPGLITKIEAILENCGLLHVPVTLRMTGCPNGCARPYIAEIGLTGRAPGKYNLYLGGAHNGSRLNRLYRENIDEIQILNELGTIIKDFAESRMAAEHFGDFVIRKGYVQAVSGGTDFKRKVVKEAEQ